ncbi:MAG: Sir2 family NAD-dependent protein deacetylase [Chloroflexi bacterium]|nr:Sir2 family NAD-dependent protein deacetylase [Chloroflexota bacterium]
MSDQSYQEQSLRRAVEAVLASGALVAMTGAGISVESGIPPFRGPGGLWTKYGEPPMNGFQQFQADPKTWWERRLRGDDVRPEMAAFDTAAPNAGHYALAELERAGILKRIITQNVDNLHQDAGSVEVIHIHGNRTMLRCIRCSARFPRADGRITYHELPPRCPDCGTGIIKGDGVMFGEPIPPDALDACWVTAERADCVLLVGTSGTVYPAAELPLIAKRMGAMLIEVNPYETALTSKCDLALRGPSAEVLAELARRVAAARSPDPV